MATETAEGPQCSSSRLVTLTTGNKLAGNGRHHSPVTDWSFPSVAMLAQELDVNTTCLVAIGQTFGTLANLADVLAWQVHSDLRLLVLHGACAEAAQFELHPQSHGATVHVLTADFVEQFCHGRPSYEKQAVRDAFSAMLHDLADVAIPSGMSYLDYFEAGNRSPRFSEVVCLRDYGSCIPGGAMSLSSIGKFNL